MRRRHRGDVDWDAYLATFHAQKPGVTERVLVRCTYQGTDPYAWVLEDVAEADRVLDLACGSAPTYQLRASSWIGIDRSAAELAAARACGADRLAIADVNQLPFAPDSFDTVVCAMALMLVTPLDGALREIARIARPGGTLHALVPTTGPLTWRDRTRLARLSAALHTTPRFPPSPLSHHAHEVFRDAGFSMTADERRRYRYPLDTDADVSRFIDSLYLPGVNVSRLIRAHAKTTGWLGHELGIPLRKITAVRHDVPSS